MISLKEPNYHVRIELWKSRIVNKNNGQVYIVELNRPKQSAVVAQTEQTHWQNEM